MDIYQLDYTLHEPEESEGWMYLAEVPALQGCIAWGKTPAETLHELMDVARILAQQGKRRAPSQGADFTQQRQGQTNGNRITHDELRQKLESLSCRFQRQGRGSHEIWINPANGRRIPIPRQRNRDLATGTLYQIIRNLGIPREEFDQA